MVLVIPLRSRDTVASWRRGGKSMTWSNTRDETWSFENGEG